MAWGARAQGVTDLCDRLAADEAGLTSLTLFRSRRFGPAEVAELAGALGRNSRLQELDAGSHPLTAPSAALLAGALAVHPSLRRLCVGDSALGDEGLKALAPGLRRLHALDCEHKGLGPPGAAVLAGLLAGGAELRELQVARNALGDQGLALLLAPLAASALLTLDASCCELGPGCGPHLQRALSSQPPLTSLRLCANALGVEGVCALASGLVQSRLRELSLDDTACGDAGAVALAAQLPGCSLARLSLARCGVGAAGAAALGRALAEGGPEGGGAALERLCLAGNQALGDAGAAALAAAALQELDLGACGVGSAGADALLGPQAAFTRLVLFANPLTQLGAQLGAPRLAALDLSGTRLDAAALARLAQALHHGAAPMLATLEVGATPATLEQGWEETLATLREARPGLDVAWRPADPGEERGVTGAPDRERRTASDE